MSNAYPSNLDSSPLSSVKELSSIDSDPDVEPEGETAVEQEGVNLGAESESPVRPEAEADMELESELSEPDSSLHSPPVILHDDDIVVGAEEKRLEKTSPHDSDSTDLPRPVAPVRHALPGSSHYPKRKRTSLYEDLSETRIENLAATREIVPKPNRQSLPGVKGVVLGHWRDSPVPDETGKHVVVGFIDSRDRLRTRVRTQTKEGSSLNETFPLPPGPGGSWVTFDRVVFSNHLVGLDHLQVKEYTRIRSLVPAELTEDERKAAEAEAVKEAIRRVKENPANENPAIPPALAYGAEVPEHLSTPRGPDIKRRKINSGFVPSNATPRETPVPETLRAYNSPQSLAAHQGRFAIDPLPGTRPTRILLGFWKPSSESDPKDRHAVYGILGQNDMFRVKVVRETRDGRYVDGNFPTGAGALWISYEDVEFDSHLQPLTRQEVKEYCRVRQFQLDRGETEDQRIENETKAVFEAQTRATYLAKQPPAVPVSVFSGVPSPSMAPVGLPGNGPELRPSRRIEPRPEGRPMRQFISENELRSSAQRMQGIDAAQRTNALARREIARAEAAQGRADRKALTRERAVAAATDAASAAAAAAAAAAPLPASPHGHYPFHESEEMQRLNKVWARQESLRLKGDSDDAKVYDGVKYARKPTGPFMGKLVSQGTIINIDGEDYVEYRVLTKPSFF